MKSQDMRVAARPITFTHLCIYLCIIFLTLKKIQTKKSQPEVLKPRQHRNTLGWTPSNHIHSLRVDVVTSQKFSVQRSRLPVGGGIRFSCGCRKSRPLSNNCTFRADRRLSRCSPVTVCLCEKKKFDCLLVQCFVKHHFYVDEWCQNFVVNLKHFAEASVFVVLQKVSKRVLCSPFCIVWVTRSVFRAGYILCIPQ